MPNVEEQEKKTIEFSPSVTADGTTSNTPETIKDDSQAKRTSFTEKIPAMVGMKPKGEGRGGTNDREKQNTWNSFCNNNRG